MAWNLYPLLVLLILQKICHGQAENDTTFETFNFNYKYLHNCLDWSGFYIYKFQNIYTLFRLLKNEFVKLPHHWHDLIINPPCRTSPLPKIVPCLPRKAFRKRSLHTFFWGGWGKHYAFTPLENGVGIYALSRFARKCGLKLVNILNLAKKIVGKNRSIRWAIM